MAWILAALCPAAGWAAGDEREGRIRLAILSFDNESVDDRERLAPLGKGLAEALIGDLSRLPRLQVLERGRIDALMAELQIQQTGLADPATVARIGRLLGVQALLMGSFTALAGTLRIDARIVSVETGLVLRAEEVTGPLEDLFRLEEALVERIAAGLNAPLTPEERRRLVRSGGGSFEAFLAYAQGIDALDGGRREEAARAFAEALRIDPGLTDAAARRRALVGPPEKGNP